MTLPLPRQEYANSGLKIYRLAAQPARVFTAFCHAALFGIAAIVASEIAPADKRATAVAVVFSGATVATILGVPLGTEKLPVTGRQRPVLVLSNEARLAGDRLRRPRSAHPNDAAFSWPRPRRPYELPAR